MNRYPHRPGAAPLSDTSQAAARSMDVAAPTLRDRVLELLRIHVALTTDEAAELLGVHWISVRPRFSELHRLGEIEDAGLRRANASGKSAVVWRIAAPKPQQDLEQGRFL